MKFRTPEEARRFLTEHIAIDRLYGWDTKTILNALSLLETGDRLHDAALAAIMAPALRVRGEGGQKTPFTHFGHVQDPDFELGE